MEKNVQISILCQLYGKLLTKKQYEFLDDYYNNDLSLSEIAEEVIKGEWGNGNDRKTRLTNAGYNYNEVQTAVNNKLSGKSTSSNKKSNETIANEVIKGLWGNGTDRKNRLTAAGYDYNAIQKIVI